MWTTWDCRRGKSNSASVAAGEQLVKGESITLSLLEDFVVDWTGADAIAGAIRKELEKGGGHIYAE